MAIAPISIASLEHRARSLQRLTIAWMTAEATITLAVAWRARSPVLLAFGGDSAIELLSAIVVLWRFRSSSAIEPVNTEKTAAYITGALLFLIAAFVMTTSILALLGYSEPQPSIVGIIVLLAAALGMPILASQKRKLAAQLASSSLNADATQSSLCGYLAWIALAGLVANALFHRPWADSIAALILIPIVAKEGWATVRAARLGCHC